MATTSAVVGVFHDLVQAQYAVEELRRAGFNENDIGFLTRADTEKTGSNTDNVAVGAVEGGLVGGAVGAAIALLIPGLGPALAGGALAMTLGAAAVGAAAGGIIGALTDIGVSRTDAEFYQSELTSGRSIVTIKSPSDPNVAADILRQSGAADVRVHEGVIDPETPVRASESDSTL